MRIDLAAPSGFETKLLRLEAYEEGEYHHHVVSGDTGLMIRLITVVAEGRDISCLEFD